MARRVYTKGSIAPKSIAKLASARSLVRSIESDVASIKVAAKGYLKKLNARNPKITEVEFFVYETKTAFRFALSEAAIPANVKFAAKLLVYMYRVSEHVRRSYTCCYMRSEMITPKKPSVALCRRLGVNVP